MKCLSHVYTVPPPPLVFSFFFSFFYNLLDVCGLHYAELMESEACVRLLALSNNISSFLPLKPGKRPAEKPFLHSTVVEQCVLTGCTAAPPSTLHPPRTDANPSGTVPAARDDCSQLTCSFQRVQCVLCHGIDRSEGKLMVFSLNFIVLAFATSVRFFLQR